MDKGISISIILAFLIILGIFVSSVTVFASGIAVGNTNPEMEDKEPGLYITEVFYDTPGVDSKEEWVELYNPTNSDIDISGLILRDNSNSWNLPFSTVINARSTIIIAKNETGFRNLYGVDPEVSGMSLRLNNDGDVLSLADNVTIDMVAWENHIEGWDIVADTNASIQRIAPTDTDTVEDWSGHMPPNPGELSWENVCNIDTGEKFVKIQTAINDPDTKAGHIIIVEVYPNTYISGDTAGEFVRIHNPTENLINLGGWLITDREGVITFPAWASIGAGASLYLAYNATVFYDEMLQKADFEYGEDSGQTPDMEKEKWGRGFKLSDNGDEVILKNDRAEIIDVVIYGYSDYTDPGWIVPPVKGAKSGVILERDRNETTGKYEDTDSAADWDDYRIYVVGQSHFPYKTFSFNGTVTVFTSPDSSYREIANAIENANESIYVNVYLFHNFYLMDHLIDAINRSVNVKVLLEGDPVNRIDDTECYIAEQIVNAGGEVRFMIDDASKGIHDRYKYDHAKYAIIDNRSTIVMSENWKNTGVPVNNTFGNRGWGIIIYNPNVTSYFRDVFFEDWKPESKDSLPFTCDDPDYGCPAPDFAPNRSIPTWTYSHPFTSANISGLFNVSPVLAPDTSLLQTKSIIGMIKGAKESVYIEQLYIYKDRWSYADPKNPLLDAAIYAARRGCDVRIMLNPTYNFEKNQATIDYVRGIAAENVSFTLEAKFSDIERTGLNKTHNKGVIVDHNKVLISSINWNENSARKNREVGVIIENDAVGEYYTRVFLYDWYNGSLPPIANLT